MTDGAVSLLLISCLSRIHFLSYFYCLYIIYIHNYAFILFLYTYRETGKRKKKTSSNILDDLDAGMDLPLPGLKGKHRKEKVQHVNGSMAPEDMIHKDIVNESGITSSFDDELSNKSYEVPLSLRHLTHLHACRSSG